MIPACGAPTALWKDRRTRKVLIASLSWEDPKHMSKAFDDDFYVSLSWSPDTTRLPITERWCSL